MRNFCVRPEFTNEYGEVFQGKIRVYARGSSSIKVFGFIRWYALLVIRMLTFMQFMIKVFRYELKVELVLWNGRRSTFKIHRDLKLCPLFWWYSILSLSFCVRNFCAALHLRACFFYSTRNLILRKRLESQLTSLKSTGSQPCRRWRRRSRGECSNGLWWTIWWTTSDFLCVWKSGRFFPQIIT